MKTLHRHLAVSLVKGYLPVLAVFLAVFSLIVLVDEIDEVGKGEYTFLKASSYLAYTLPSRMVFLAPFVALLGSIMALGGLANGRELIAMQASGISPYQIAGAVMKYGLVFMLGVAAMDQFLTPTLDQEAYFNRSRALSESKAYQSKQGFWFKDDNRYVRIRKMLYGEVPQGIDIFEMDEGGKLIRYLYAREAVVDSPLIWILTGIEEKTFQGQTFSQKHVENMVWNSPLKSDEMKLLTLPTSSLAPTDLYQYVKVLHRKGQNASRYELAFWQKVIRPFDTGLMVLVSFPFVFGPLRSATTGKRVLIGSMTGLGYYLITQILQQVGGLFGLNPWVVVTAPFVVLLISTVILWRQYF